MYTIISTSLIILYVVYCFYHDSKKRSRGAVRGWVKRRASKKVVKPAQTINVYRGQQLVQALEVK